MKKKVLIALGLVIVVIVGFNMVGVGEQSLEEAQERFELAKKNRDSIESKMNELGENVKLLEQRIENREALISNAKQLMVFQPGEEEKELVEKDIVIFEKEKKSALEEKNLLDAKIDSLVEERELLVKEITDIEQLIKNLEVKKKKKNLDVRGATQAAVILLQQEEKDSNEQEIIEKLGHALNAISSQS